MKSALKWKKRTHKSLLLKFLSTSALPSPHYPLRDLYPSIAQIQSLSSRGEIADARKLFDELPHRSTIAWNSMIFGYSQHGLLDQAHSLFDSFSGRNTRTWTILVSGYAKAGRLDEARELFNSMPDQNPVSWNAMISGYVQNGSIRNARELFDEMPERNCESWNAMVTGYCRECMMEEARGLFELMPEKNLVSWTVMISGYVRVSKFVEGWRIFRRMIDRGFRPDQSSFAAAVNAVVGVHDLCLLENFRTLAIKTGFEADVVIGTATLNAYTRYSQGLDLAKKFFGGMKEVNDYTWSTMISALSHVGRLDDAASVFECDPEKSIASMTAMLTGYAQHGRIEEARFLFDQIQNPNVVSWNAMIAGYSQNGMLDEAKKLFDGMPVRNPVSWAAMISGFAQNGRSEEALEFLIELHRLGMLPSPSSFTSGFSACAAAGAIEIGRQLHSLAIKVGSQFNSFVNNGLITMYAKCKNIGDVNQVFRWMRTKDSISWNSMITALAQNYMLEDAKNVFEKMPHRDVVSWSAVISAYDQAEQGNEAFELFRRMLAEGTLPNSLTMTSLLSASGNLGIVKLGRQIHCLACKLGNNLNLIVGNSLITMYWKCGCVDSFSVFYEMRERDTITWNSILAGCSQHGFGREAIEIFEKMKAEGVSPNQITFVNVLSACSHAGLVDEGWRYFKSMSKDYSLMPLKNHYACIVDLLGRAGHLYETEAFIENMPIEPDSVVWAALLGACRIHQNVELGRRVAERLFEMEPQYSAHYVLLSNIYASLKMWDEVEEVRKLMRLRGVKKEPGCSWMQIKNKMHVFITNDKQHEQIKEIHRKLKDLYDWLRGSGYVPDTKFVLHDLEEEQKENVLLYHSEKLAVAYALLATPEGTPIQILKNLRICGDCHTFFSFVSKVTSREIDIRDGNRFHHFRNGVCTCGDYW
ncbi:pentatricopeptide repeat-containing protein At4g02750-like [Asparagus officinalis]|uniref:pentatricopeptide repeat-containing protein At4g02750-like n=1 Tax=Asparagus officinalis TaxID=4686 RepID=UPI00098E7097|nr:pentatricopeptide repeat-containing protein At4g02750-like [Asparagus officinalis]